MKGTNKTNQFFRTVMLMCSGKFYTIKELSEELGIELRTVYRYIDDLKESNFFEIEMRGKRMRIARDSIFLSNVMQNLFLTDKEADALGEILEGLDTPNKTLLGLRSKVRNARGNYLEPVDTDGNSVLANNLARIQEAMDNKRLCMLRGYTSLHSNTTSDRLVEPFFFLGSKNDVRCYELATRTCKTFKMSRCKEVEVFPVDWQFERLHKRMYTDIFNFSGEEQIRVRLLMGNLSKTILLEEYPDAAKFVIPNPDGRWLLDSKYCSMKGVGRFYLGLFEDIEIVDSPEFEDYISTCIKNLAERS